MANYCNNWINFEGSKTSLNRLEKKLKTYDKCKYFTEWSEYVIGIGKLDEGKGFHKKYGTDFNVYYMYGTRWFEFTIDREDNHLRVFGDSAWSPPIKFVEEVCKKFKLKADMDYEEGGCDFGGKTTFDENGIVEQNNYSYNHWRYIDCYEGWQDELSERIYDEDLSLEDVLEECPYAEKEEIEKIYNKSKTI